MANNLVTTFEGITVGDTIKNPDVGTFTVIAINADQDRVLLFNRNPNASNRYIGAWALQKKPNGNGYYWGQGHYFGGHLQAATEYVLGIDGKVEEPDDIVIVAEDGMISDVFAKKQHNIEIIDLDGYHFDEYKGMQNRIGDISKEFKRIY